VLRKQPPELRPGVRSAGMSAWLKPMVALIVLAALTLMTTGCAPIPITLTPPLACAENPYGAACG
jgi:hypothetical protein